MRYIASDCRVKVEGLNLSENCSLRAKLKRSNLTQTLLGSVGKPGLIAILISIVAELTE